MKPLGTLLLLGFCASACADQFYLTAGVNCGPEKSELTVSFRGYWNVEGEAAIAKLDPNTVDPRNLVSFRQSAGGKYSIDVRKIRVTCSLDGRDYVVEFSPALAPRFHPDGFCATRVGASAIVLLEGKILAVGAVDACTEEGTVTRAITVSPGKPPIYEQVDARVFYASAP